MIILDFSLILTVLFSKLAEGKVWNDITADVKKNLINKKLSPCRSPIDIEHVLVWSGILGVDDMNVCIYEALADIEVPIEANKTISISFEKKTQDLQSHCAASTSNSFSKDDTFMIIRTSKDATISVYDREKCKNIESSDSGGHEVNTTGQVNNIKSSDLEGHKGNIIGKVDNSSNNEIRPRNDLDENNSPSIETTSFYLILLGPFCGFIGLVLFSMMILAVYCRRKKNEPKRRRTYRDIFSSVRIKESLRR